MATLKKIQLVKWAYNPLSKLFDLYELVLAQASSSSISKKQTLRVPGLYLDQIEKIKINYFPDLNKLSTYNYSVSPRLIIRNFGIYGMLPFIFIFPFRYLAIGN